MSLSRNRSITINSMTILVRRVIREPVPIRNLEPPLDAVLPRMRRFETDGIGKASDLSRSCFLLRADDTRQKVLAVLDEAGAFSDTVVEAHCRRIRFVGQPVDPRAALTRSLRIHVFDQFAADA